MKRCKKGIFLMTFFLGGSLLFSDQYAIQLGSFSDASKVPYTAQEIRNKGFSPVWQMDGAKEGMIRLLTGNYDWYWQAWTELAQIRSLYPDAFICKVADDQPELQMLEKTGSARMIPDQIKIGPEPGSKELLAYYQSWAGSKNVAQARQILQGMDSRALSSDARAWREVYLGNLSLREELWDDAIDHWLSAVSNSNDKPTLAAITAARSLGMSMIRRGEHSNAVKWFTWMQSAEIDSQSAPLLAESAICLGRYAQKDRDYPTAAGWYAKARKLSEGTGDREHALEAAMEEVGMVLELAGRGKGSYEESALYAAQVLSDYSDQTVLQTYATTRLMRIESLWNAGLYSEAQKEAAVLASEPEWKREALAARYWQAESLMSLKKWDEAAAVFDELSRAEIGSQDCFPSLNVKTLSQEKGVKAWTLAGNQTKASELEAMLDAQIESTEEK